MADYDIDDFPDIAAWRASLEGSASWVDYLSNLTPATVAIAVAEVIFPHYTKVGDCIIRTASVAHASKILGGDAPRQQKEALANHLDVWDAFDFDLHEVPEAAVARLVEAMRTGWESAFRLQFPERTCEVLVTEDYGPTVTLYQL